MENRRSIRKIIEKYLKGKATEAEKRSLFSFFDTVHNQKTDWSEREHGNKEEVEENILKKIYGTIDGHPKKSRVTLPFFKRWRAVAAVILLCGVGYLALDRYAIKGKENAVIHPGSYRAVLQLADGSKVFLDSSDAGDIARTSGLAIRLDKKGELVYTEMDNAGTLEGQNTITVPKGGQFKVKLADGTSIWLNASSSLTYPTRFSGHQRRVKLTGEAYFEVSQRVLNGTRGERIPFIVETDKQRVEVLGTGFNISAYVDEETVKTTLIEGAVKVSSIKGQTSQILKPGQQSVLTNGKLLVQEVDALQFIAWKQGDFAFDKMPLEEIMRQIARWYDVQVTYQGSVGKIEFGGSISRSKDIREVLDVLELAGVHFTIRGRRIMVSP